MTIGASSSRRAPTEQPSRPRATPPNIPRMTIAARPTIGASAPTTHEPESYELLDESPEGMYELFEARGWGDGLPLVPPTPERVDAMVAYASGDADEVLCTLLPRAGLVTRSVVAINAVLAGCPPDVFPVVLSAVRAL